MNAHPQGQRNSLWSPRHLAVYSKKEGFDLSRAATSARLNNYIQKLGANQDQIETFIAYLANSPEPKKLIDVANQVAQLSRSESIPLEDLGDHIKQKEEEKQRLEEEIKQGRAIFENTDIDIQTINEYKQLRSRSLIRMISSRAPKGGCRIIQLQRRDLEIIPQI